MKKLLRSGIKWIKTLKPKNARKVNKKIRPVHNELKSLQFFNECKIITIYNRIV